MKTNNIYPGPHDLVRHNTSKLITGYVELDPMEFLENVKEVVEVFDSNIFYIKVINNEAELDGVPFVVPEAMGGFSFIVTFSKKVGSEKIVGQNAGLGKAIAQPWRILK